MNVRLLSLLLVGATSPVAAQEIRVTPTTPVEGQPVLDFRIENCTGKFGVGLMRYLGPVSQHLTDLCFLIDSGTVVAGEVAYNLTATHEGTNSQTFEDLSMGLNEDERNIIIFDGEEHAENCAGERFESFDYAAYNVAGYEGYAVPGYGFAHTLGYVVTATSNTPSASAAEVFLYVNDVLFTDINEDGWDTGIIMALATFEGQNAILDIVEGWGTEYGAADGTLELSIGENGDISMTGGFTAHSSRISGQQPTDMSFLEADVIHFRGHLLGADGVLVRGYGIISGTITAANGVERPFRSSISMLSCLSGDGE